MSGASANSCVIRSPRLCGFHQRDEGDQRSNLSPCLLSASDPEFAYARGFYVWSPDSGVLPKRAMQSVINMEEMLCNIALLVRQNCPTLPISVGNAGIRSLLQP